MLITIDEREVCLEGGGLGKEMDISKVVGVYRALVVPEAIKEVCPAEILCQGIRLSA